MPEIRPVTGEIQPGLREAKNLARREYASASHRRTSAEDLGLALAEFQTSLNRAVWDRTREDRSILSYAMVASGNIRALNEARAAKGIIVQDDLASELSVLDLPAHDVSERQRRNLLKDERRTANEAEMPAAALQTEARRKIFDWFRVRYPGTISLLDSYAASVPHGREPVDIDAFHNFIADNVGKWMLSRNTLSAGKRILVDKGPEGFKGRHQSEEQVMRGMAEYLLAHTDAFKDLKGKVELDKFDFWEDAIDSVWTKSRTEEVVLLLDERVGKFVLKEWLRKTGTEARDDIKSRKIYETPYYKTLLRKLRIEGAKKNGVGGVIVDGPPGVGKTEIIQEKNKQKGFGTRVIGIHYYTSVSELLGDRKIQIQGTGGAISPSSLAEVVKVFEGESGEKFGAYVLDLYKTLQAEGKISKGQTLTDLLRSFVTEEVEDIITKSDLSVGDWDKIRASFVDRQKMRIVRAALPGAYQETVADIVAGEILLAIENKQMALLDEVEKAGPNGLGGLLTFLAKSPGRDVLKIGQTEVELPPWFNVDATSNSMADLDPYLKDRFSHLSITTPPVKDQLMIAGVRLSDSQGNILLNNYEQRQLVGFFTYVIPEINSILKSEEIGMEALSLRSVKDLTAYLVNFENMQRSSITFGEALRMLLLQNRAWEKIPELAEKFSELKNRYPDIFGDKPLDLTKGPFVSARIDDLSGQRAAGYEAVLESPLVTAITGMADDPDSIKTGRPVDVVLTDEESGKVKEALDKEARDSTRDLGGAKKAIRAGFVLRLKRGEGQRGYIPITLDGQVGPREGDQHIADDAVQSGDRIVVASADGKVVVLSTTESSGLTKTTFVRLFDRYEYSGQHSKQPTEIMESRGNAWATIDSRGTIIAAFSKDENGKLEVRDVSGGSKRFEEVAVEDYSLSEDGKYIVIQKTDGSSLLKRTATGDTVALLPRVGRTEFAGGRQEKWIFTRNNLLVKQDALGGVATNAYLLAS